MFLLPACKATNNQDNANEFYGYQAWEDFIYESVQENKINYTLRDYNEAPILLSYFDGFRCKFVYDKNGNIIADYSANIAATHNWYILEKSSEGEIAFSFKSIKNAQWGSYSLVNDREEKIYFTNRVLTTDAFLMSGFNFAATNGANIYDVENIKHNNFQGNYFDDLKNIKYPVRVDASEFEATNILSRTTGVQEETNWNYVEFHIYKIIITFVNDFNKAIVKTYDFYLRFNADSDDYKALDEVLSYKSEKYKP